MIDIGFLAALLEQPSKQPANSSHGANVKAAEPVQYLDGLCWVMDMYHTGACPNYRFLYDGLGPHAKDILKELEQGTSSKILSGPDGPIKFRLPYSVDHAGR